VKDTQNLLPLTVDKHKRILPYVLGDVGGYMDAGGGSSARFIKLLEDQGFVVTKFDYSQLEGTAHNLTNKPVRELKEEYDLVLYYASLKTASNQTVVRITWARPSRVRPLHSLSLTMRSTSSCVYQESPTLS
jgi:beta-N-acetylhexosaminidase